MNTDGPQIRLYTENSLQSVAPVLLVVVFFGIGISLLFQGQYLGALLLIFMAGWPALKLIRMIQSLSISGDSIIVGYLLKKDGYHALEIESIDWKVALKYERNTRLSGSYTFLLILLTNGKRIVIPGSPYSAFNIRKPLLDWCRTYNPTVLENITREGINSLSEN